MEKKKTKFYTLKQFEKENQILLEHKASEKVLYKLRSVWKLASENWKLTRVSQERKQKAEKVYKSILKMWKYKDLNLEYYSMCSEHGENGSKYYSRLEDEEAEKIKELLKDLNLVLTFSTFAHIEDKNGEQII